MLGALYLSVTKWPFPKSQVTHLDQRPVSDRRVAGSGQYRIDQSAHLRPLSPLANPGWMQVCTAVSLARVRDDFWTRFVSRFCKQTARNAADHRGRRDTARIRAVSHFAQWRPDWTAGAAGFEPPHQELCPIGPTASWGGAMVAADRAPHSGRRVHVLPSLQGATAVTAGHKFLCRGSNSAAPVWPTRPDT